MRRHILLLLLPLLASCTKDTSKPVQDISGDYYANVHYYANIQVGPHSYSPELDTSYITTFHINHKNDTIHITFTGYNGENVKDKLKYSPSMSVSDSIRFAGTRNGGYLTTYLSFFKEVRRFQYSSFEKQSSGAYKSYSTNGW